MKIIICVSGRHNELVGQELVLCLILLSPSPDLEGGGSIVSTSWSYEHLSELRKH